MEVEIKGQGEVKDAASADTASSDTATADTDAADTAVSEPPRKPLRGGQDVGW